MRNLCCVDIRQTLNAGTALLEVRTTGGFKAGGLPEAKNIPLAILPLPAHEQIDKEKPVFIDCRAGGRAVVAESILAGLGFSDVTSIGSIHNFKHCH